MAADAIERVIETRAKDLGGFEVRRALPAPFRRTVGPFIFLDEMGPTTLAPNKGVDVRPHPHIGLSTVTYLFEGSLRHRDSHGVDQIIEPGDVNWMTAGSGVVHSERSPPDRSAARPLHGIQTWVAAPAELEDEAPSFRHHPKEALPTIERDGARITLIAGEALGAASPARGSSPIFYLFVEAEDGAVVALPDEYEERAVYLVDGALTPLGGGEPLAAKTLGLATPGAPASFRANGQTRAMLLGGAPVGQRHIFWNFVASSEARIEAAKRDWRAAAATGFKSGRFTLPDGENEHIPLPDA
ncbi:MAG: pirin family protein [Parvularculaceae bacterium]